MVFSGDTGGGRNDPRSVALGADSGSLPLPPGTVLDGRFIVRSVLGRGGFGVTYMAEHTRLRQRVALKEHFPEQFAVRDGVSARATSTGATMFKWGLERFIEEAQRLARFKHPSIVTVTDVFEANGTAYMALAYEEGETLGAWLARLGRAPTQAELDRLLAPILDALEHVHGHGILHRDIAPDNIMIRRDGTPVLIDFGSARQAMAERSHTLTGIVKHGYSPPEQYTRSSNRHGPWSDIYALGATLYRALTGAAPQEATDRQLGDTVQDISDFAAKGYRPAFLAAVNAALALQPPDRPQSVAAWRPVVLSNPRSALAPRSAVDARPTAGVPFPNSRSRPTSGPQVAAKPPLRSGQPPSGLLTPTPPPRKTGALLGVLAMALILLVAGVLYAFTSNRSEEAQRLTEIRREIAAATTSEALDRIALREPKMASEIAKRREVLTAIARTERLNLLRELIGRETATIKLDRIAVEAPELRPDIEKRKAELAAEAIAAHAARIRVLRQRIAVAIHDAELDNIAAEAPELASDVRMRKAALSQERIRTERPTEIRRESKDARADFVRFAERMTEFWNKGILDPSLFADNLIYFGKEVSRADAAAETAKYFQRWHERRFELMRESISATESNDGTFFVTWEYQFRGSRIGKTTQGRGRYFLRLRRHDSSFQIVEMRDDYTEQQ